MALKNMLKLNDKVTFGRAGEAKRSGKIIKMNPKTAHIKCPNGDVMGVSYGLIQKPSAKKKPKVVAASKRKVVKKNPAKKSPAKKAAPGYAGWLEKRTVAELRKLEKALGVITKSRNTPALSDAKKKHAAVKKELSKRKRRK